MRFALPAELDGKTIADSGIEQDGLQLLAVIRNSEEHNSIGIRHNQKLALDPAPPEAELKDGDVIVVYGTLAAYNRLTRNLR